MAERSSRSKRATSSPASQAIANSPIPASPDASHGEGPVGTCKALHQAWARSERVTAAAVARASRRGISTPAINTGSTSKAPKLKLVLDSMARSATKASASAPTVKAIHTGPGGADRGPDRPDRPDRPEAHIQTATANTCRTYRPLTIKALGCGMAPAMDDPKCNTASNTPTTVRAPT
jgi:hypothetical protein